MSSSIKSSVTPSNLRRKFCCCRGSDVYMGILGMVGDRTCCNDMREPLVWSTLLLDLSCRGNVPVDVRLVMEYDKELFRGLKGNLGAVAVCGVLPCGLLRCKVRGLETARRGR